MEWIRAKTDGVGMVITTRDGGVSEPPYQSFNLAYHVGDQPAVVHANRLLLAKSMGLELSQLCFMEQVHGTEVVEVSPGIKPPTCDAMITNHSQLALLVMTADCVPILFYDPQNKAIGVAHAGWKGTVGRIAAKTLVQMKNRYGTNSENLLVYFGPSIRECCYEIGDIVKQAVIANFSAHQQYLFTRNGKTYFDLIRCNRDVLIEMGVNPQHIVQNKVCVACHSKHYFSYRAADGITGRQVTGLWMKGE
jgi:hypothetical protein